MNPLRFCFATTFYPPYSVGGDGLAVQRLAQALVRRGHAVTVVHDADAMATQRGPHPPLSEADERDASGVRVVRLASGVGALSSLLVQQAGRPVLQAQRLARLLGDPAFDVVHFHNVSLLGGPGVLAYPKGAVTLYTAHEHWLVCPTHVLWRDGKEPCDEQRCLPCVLRQRRPPQLWRYQGAIARGLQHVDAVIAQSEFSRGRHAQFGLERQMELLPCFIPEQRSVEPVRRARPYFFFAGRLERPKGLDDVLDAFAQFREADLLLAGEGNERARWQARARALPHVQFLGQQSPEAVRAHVAGAVAVLAPSVGAETFGLTVIEAFGEGTPVIARRRGSYPELLARGGGELFDALPELRAALERLSTDSVHRARLSAEATRAAKERYAEATVLEEYFQILRRAAERRGHARVLGATKEAA